MRNYRGKADFKIQNSKEIYNFDCYDKVEVWVCLPSKAGGPRVSVVGGSRREHRASLNRRFNQ